MMARATSPTIAAALFTSAPYAEQWRRSGCRAGVDHDERVSRRWFWPLIGAGCLCLSGAGGLVLGVLLTRHFVSDLDTEPTGVHVFFEIAPWPWITAAAILGVLVLASFTLAARLRERS
jgi:hypothetical protein